MRKNSGKNTKPAKKRGARSRSTTPFEEVLRTELQNREVAIAYVNTLLAENDEQGVLLALRDIADALSMSTVAEKAGVNRESLYKMLSGRRDPRLGTLFKVLQALGLGLRAVDRGTEVQTASTKSAKAGNSHTVKKPRHRSAA